MVLEPDTADRDLAGPLSATAFAVALVTGVLLAVALAAELVRRRRRAPRLIAVLDHLVPAPVRTLAIALLAVSATLIPARAPAADGSVRTWLEEPTGTTTTSPGVVTPGALDTLVPPAPSPAPDGPVVFAPEDPPAPSPAPPPPPPPTPVAVHVVRPGECLWSIAARFLGPGADDRAIDLTWRAIYARNRETVGDDPALIHPGLVLRIPPPSPTE
jgi:nucleoid-associated protein YgaU